GIESMFYLREIITGKLVSSDADGLRLSIGFFDDIYIPTHHMPNPNRYEPENTNKNKGTWFWDYGEEIDSSFNINYTDKVKFQVQSVSYPPIPVEQPKESKPFGEIITGKLVSSDADGLRLSIGFFDDIYIPTHHMPNPNCYEPENTNKNKGTWFWDYGEEIDSSFNINYTDKVKFQVQSVSYPPIPVEQPKESKPFAPMI
ncbi:hypothetical protein RYX36_026989, partial [Vicia faba]